MIVLTNVEKRFGSKILLNRVSASINPQKRTGLIGPNGAGKTMLLRMLTGEEEPDRGTVSIPARITLGYLPQELDFQNKDSVLDIVLEPFPALQNKRRHLTESELSALPSRAKKILTGLGIPAESWEKSSMQLSGGYRMRVLLARILIMEPDFLLLDEPTNHLDMDSLIWMERFMQQFRGGMLIVSHDRDFLNRTTECTAELKNGGLTQYNGGVTAFFAWAEEQKRVERARIKNLSDKISQTKRFITRFKAKNTKASQARSKMKLLERLEDGLPEAEAVSRTVHFTIPESPMCGVVPLRVEDLSVGYDGDDVIEHFSLNVKRGDKIAVVGPNGAGKSTLLKACAGLLEPSAGYVERGHNATVRYFCQHRLDHLDPRLTVYKTVEQASSDRTREYIQSILGAFLFSGDDVEKTVAVLSGGEKSRLSLAAIIADPGNVLLLDEPTNHLDLQSVEILGESLRSYGGTLLVVSHDEFFISKIANRMIEMRPGTIRDFPGSPAEYRSYIEAGLLESIDDLAGEPSKTEPSPKSEEKTGRIRRREERKRLERSIQRVERDISETEAAVDELKSLLSDPQRSADYEFLYKTNSSLIEKRHHADRLLEKWERLHRELEGKI